MQSLQKSHLDVARHILRYDKGTINYDLLYKRSEDCKLAKYHDADYLRYHNTQRSSTGYMFKLNSRKISGFNKRQPIVSLSTKEAEYRAIGAAQEST